MTAVAIVVMALQATLMLVDEVRFHRRRELPRWERIGHPIDTLSVFVCCLVTLVVEPGRPALITYAALGALSCLLVTKDELVHARHCEPFEHWLHALLFSLHPLLLIAIALLWLDGARSMLVMQTLAVALFGAYQAIYWNWLSPAPRRNLE
jgi:hypothetical protein